MKLRDIASFFMAGQLLLFVVGCSGSDDPTVPPPSPREQAQTVGQVYAAVQVAAYTAETSPLLASKPDTKLQIAATTHATTDAVLAYMDASANCFRDPVSGTIGNAPGKVCDQGQVGRLLTAAEAAASNASALLAAFGFTPSTGAKPLFATEGN